MLLPVVGTNTEVVYKQKEDSPGLLTLMTLCVGMSVVSSILSVPEVIKGGRDEEGMEGWLHIKLKAEMI